jgi:hypothetical protein
MQAPNENVSHEGRVTSKNYKEVDVINIFIKEFIGWIQNIRQLELDGKHHDDCVR